jgi:cytochrome c2
MSLAPEQPEQDLERRSYRGVIFLLAVLCVATAAYVVYREQRADRTYRRHQQRFHALLAASGKPEPFDPRIRLIAAGGRTDRCPSCHLAVSRDVRFAGVENPQRGHPGALLAHHPPRRFGCTTCHGAGGDRLDDCLPARGDPDGRALGRRRAVASCRACHSPVEELPGSEALTVGLRAYRRLGCGGCHRAQGLDPGRPVGPLLDGVVGKLRLAFLRAMLADPQRARPGAAMPSFFSDELLRGAPDFAARRVRGERATQIAELLAFLQAQAPHARVDPCPPSGAGGHPDRARGRALFLRLGCVACHVAAPEDAAHGVRGLGAVGPDLRAAGARLRPAWITSWLRSPRALHPATRMPDFRLSCAEVGDLVSDLAARGAPTVEEQWPVDAAQVQRGRALAERLGCGGCHGIAALKRPPPAGPDLDGFGDKPLDLLDWGHAASSARSFWRWSELKLTAPLAFDRRPHVLAMPWQRLRAGELEGLLLVLRGLVAEGPQAALRAPVAVRDRRLREGERLVEELGCRQCHSIGARGGRIAALLTRPSDRPPSLDGEGSKVQPGWLHGYLIAPLALRPWLTLRMPTPSISPAEAETLAAYLGALDGASYPFYTARGAPLEGARLEDALRLFDRLQCLRCHLLSNAARLKPGELSPDLALSGSRLRREWLVRFTLEPQQLMPGTKMPTLFPLADEDDPRSRITPQPSFFGGRIDEQIEALTDLSLWWGSAAAARRVSARAPRSAGD